MGFATPHWKIRTRFFNSKCAREAGTDVFLFVRGAFGIALAMTALALPLLMAGILRI